VKALENESQPAILGCVSWFHNLGSLSLSNARLAVTFYKVLINLPNLRDLSLVSCHIANPPPHFPQSFPSFRLDPVEITATSLTISDVNAYWFVPDREEEDDDEDEEDYEYENDHDHYQPPSILHLFTLFPRVRAVTLGSFVQMPASFLQQITSLSLPAMSSEDAVELLNNHIPPTPNLLHLTVVAKTEHPHAPRQGLPPPPPLRAALPLLESFTGPAPLAADVLRCSPTLISLMLNTFLGTTQGTLAIIEAANGASLREISLRVTEWDDEVLLAIVQRLHACQDLRVVFHFSQPSDVSLFHSVKTHE
jgi:hypothetical protein